MLTALMLSSALLSQVMTTIPELEALEMEIAQVQAQRAALGGFANNSKRDVVDRKLDLLRRVHDRASSAVNNRLSVCMHGQPPLRTGPNAPAVVNNGQPVMVCNGAAAGVVARVRRIEEIRDQLRYGTWTYANHDQRQALNKEVEALEQGL